MHVGELQNSFKQSDEKKDVFLNSTLYFLTAYIPIGKITRNAAKVGEIGPGWDDKFLITTFFYFQLFSK